MRLSEVIECGRRKGVGEGRAPVGSQLHEGSGYASGMACIPAIFAHIAPFGAEHRGSAEVSLGICPFHRQVDAEGELANGSMTIPNIITVGRLLIVPLLIYALVHHYNLVAFLLFVIAGVSDGVDGYIARRYDQSSELGAWIDPIADKLLMTTVYLILGFMDHLPDWLVILVISRDVLIVGAVMLSSLMGRPLIMMPIMVSKATTVAQIALAAVVLYLLAFDLTVELPVFLLVLLTAGLTIVSGASYFVIWMRHLSAR